MVGSPKYLAKNLMKALSPTWRESDQEAATRSRHQRKRELRQAAKKDGIILTNHALAKGMGVYSVATKVRYRNAFTQFFQYVREEYGIRSTKKIEPAHVREFLELKVAQGSKRQTVYTYASAMEKLEVALNRRTNAKASWSDEIAKARKLAKEVLDKTTESRSFDRPEALIDKVEDALYRTAAKLQLEGGARISEISELTERNVDEDRRQFVLTNTKGGRQRNMEVSEELYADVVSIISREGKFEFDRADYAKELRIASGLSGQRWHGSHGLRWNFAQRKFVSLQRDGMVYDEALREVAERLGHSRPSITLHYLR